MVADGVLTVAIGFGEAAADTLTAQSGRACGRGGALLVLLGEEREGVDDSKLLHPLRGLSRGQQDDAQRGQHHQLGRGMPVLGGRGWIGVLRHFDLNPAVEQRTLFIDKRRHQIVNEELVLFGGTPFHIQDGAEALALRRLVRAQTARHIPMMIM